MARKRSTGASELYTHDDYSGELGNLVRSTETRHVTDWGRILLIVLICFVLLVACLYAFGRIYINKLSKESYEAFQSEEIYTKPADDEDIETDVGGSYVKGELVLMPVLGTPKEDMEQLIESYGLTLVGYIDLMDLYQVEVPDAQSREDLEALAEELRAEPVIESVELNFAFEAGLQDYLPVDDWDGYQLSDTEVGGSNWGVEAINAPWFWENFNLGPIDVGVIDQSFCWNHRDLNIVSFYCNDFAPGEVDYCHGTHVSGIIGAIHNNGKDVAGVVEDARIHAIGMFGQPENEYDDLVNLAASVAKEISEGARVINCSFGYYSMEEEQAYYLEVLGEYVPLEDIMASRQQDSDILGTFLQRALDKDNDYLICVSAGNDATDAYYNSAFSAIRTPGVMDRIIVVGSAGFDGYGYYCSEFSNYGDRVDVVAPGEAILSTIQSSYVFPSWVDYYDGTSMATPMVTGVAANVWAFYPELTGAQIKAIIVDSADTPVSGTNLGMVNLKTAFTKEYVGVTGVTLDYSEKVLAIGETFSLQATIVPLNATYHRLIWKSSNPDIASVSYDGVIEALAVGETTITVTNESGKSASCHFTVVPEIIQMQSGFVIYPTGDCKVDLEVEGRDSGNSMYIYFQCVDGKGSDFSVFVRPAAVIELKIPKASYKIYYAEGINWYGIDYRFGDGTAYNEVEDIKNLTVGYAIWFGGVHDDAEPLNSHEIPGSDFPG